MMATSTSIVITPIERSYLDISRNTEGLVSMAIQQNMQPDIINDVIKNRPYRKLPRSVPLIYAGLDDCAQQTSVSAVAAHPIHVIYVKSTSSPALVAMGIPMKKSPINMKKPIRLPTIWTMLSFTMRLRDYVICLNSIVIQ